MVKFFGNIIGSVIIVRRDQLKAGEVTGIIINPENGDFMGLLGVGYKKITFVISEIDIEGMGDGAVLVNGKEAISGVGEIIRIKKVLDQKIKIVGQKVKTESGIYLGKVTEATLSLKQKRLDKIYVSQRGLRSIISGDLIISSKKIIEISNKQIVVIDDFAKARLPKVATAAATLAE